MHDDHDNLVTRLARFIRERVEPAVYPRATALDVRHWSVPDEPVPFSVARRQDYEPTPPGWAWGRAWSSTWFRISGDLPTGWDPRRSEILVDLGFTAERPGFQVEGLAYRENGTIIKAVSPRSSFVPYEGDVAGSVDIFVEAAANPDVAGEYTFGPTPLGDVTTAGDQPLYRLGSVEIAERDDTVWELLQDMRIVRDMIDELPVDTTRRSGLLNTVTHLLDVLDPCDVPGTAQDGRDVLASALSAPAHASAHQIVAVGHAHIDSAWLWPVRETVRKVARTFGNVLDLMDRDPHFVFTASSAQQYAWVRDHYPELFARVRERVSEGRFVPAGGMWVEADTNMPGGEALIRQFSHGKRFFQEEFGVETVEVWLPDSFGYSAALPQIAAGTGNRWFLTQKLSWNQTNQLPHHTFWWEGIDGSQVFTHFPPADTYISQLTPDELLHTERNFREAGAAKLSLVPFGWGDGGGGPTREMIAAAVRSRDLEGLPQVEMGTQRNFFERAESEYPHAPVWRGELYLEKHRGTYTSQLRTKQGNRRSEHLLHEAELWATTATVRCGAPYPHETLREAWETVLLLQFHDILPGSSIAWVHRDAETAYGTVRETLDEIVESSIRLLAGNGNDEFVVNSSPDAREGVRPYSIAPRRVDARAVTVTEHDSGSWTLDNGTLRADIDSHGRVTSLVDHASKRDAIAPDGFGNRLVLHRDTPAEWDAWDIDDHYRRTARSLDEDPPNSLVVSASDDGTCTVATERTVGASSITQRLSLAPDGTSLDVETTIDWHETQKLLKMNVDLDVHADDTQSETQFGYASRPTHSNTSWDAARFEFCAHRWVYVGEPGYGVAIANDSTYGHDARAARRAGGGRTTSVGLSLIRSPLFPDPVADQGLHITRATIRPHAELRDAVRDGYAVNLPRRTVRGDRASRSLFRVDGDSAVPSVVKLADDGTGDVILRLYESLGSRTSARVVPDFPTSGWYRTDLLERVQGTRIAEHDVELEFGPHEIITLRFVRP